MMPPFLVAITAPAFGQPVAAPAFGAAPATTGGFFGSSPGKKSSQFLYIFHLSLANSFYACDRYKAPAPSGGLLFGAPTPGTFISDLFQISLLRSSYFQRSW